MKRQLWRVAAPLFLLVTASCIAQDDAASDGVTEADAPFLLNYPALDDPDGRVILTNDHVVAQRLVVPAGEWEGIHSHPGDQIYVHIKGGVWSGRLGGDIEYQDIPDEDGAVGWMDAIPLSAGHESGNTGDADIDLVYVTLKADAPIAPLRQHEPQAYPDVRPELVLENDRMIVQRLLLAPGQWTGVHRHPGNQVYVQVTDGTWSERRDGSTSEPVLVAAGSAGWVDAFPDGDVHDMGNTGNETIHLVLVTVK